MLKAIYLSLAMLFTACQAQTTSPILEVIGVYHDDKTGIDGIMLMEVEKGRRLERFHTKLNPQKHGSLAVGDRAQITGNYQEREIRNIKKITRLANPDKARCEATQGSHWKPQGMAQIPACITTYTDAGKSCTASDQCQGDCIVSNTEKSAVCATTSSPFGCRATIEDFRKNKGVMCMD